MNCAGILIPSSNVLLHELAEDDWNKTIDVNLNGVYLCMKYQITQMLNQEPLIQVKSAIKGSIVNVSSFAGKIPVPKWSAYCASKFGVTCLTQSTAKEYAESGIRINAVCPGFVETPLIDYIISDTSRSEAAKNKNYSGRFASAKEIADSIYFLGCGTVPFIHGACLSVDGGGAKV